jgi:hypothetical protein
VTANTVIDAAINVAMDVITGVYIRPKSSSIIELVPRINLMVFLK